jgi:hypothetical protein
MAHHEAIGRRPNKLTLFKTRPRVFGACVLLALATLYAGPAKADEVSDRVILSDTAFVLGLEPQRPLGPVVAPLSFDSGPVFAVDATPSGIIVPDASSYFDLGSAESEQTYLTPRVNGVQLSWTEDRTERANRAGYAHDDGAKSSRSRPKSVGANFKQKVDRFDLSFGGDYGRTPKTVPSAIRLVNDAKLLRLGLNGGFGAFTFGGWFGSEADPRDDLGQTMSWDLFSRYDIGPVAMGLVYNYTAVSESPTPSGIGVAGTLQAGMSYFLTPRMAVTANLAYGNYVAEGGAEDSGGAGVLGFSFAF